MKFQTLQKKDANQGIIVTVGSKKNIFGIGVAAHSYLENKRYSNTENIEEYIKNIKNNEFVNNITIHEIQTKEEKTKEYMLLGLRKIEGININLYKNKFGENPIFEYRKELDKLVNQELIEIDGNYIKLTPKGLDLANLVWEEFV